MTQPSSEPLGRIFSAQASHGRSFRVDLKGPWSDPVKHHDAAHFGIEEPLRSVSRSYPRQCVERGHARSGLKVKPSFQKKVRWIESLEAGLPAASERLATPVSDKPRPKPVLRLLPPSPRVARELLPYFGASAGAAIGAAASWCLGCIL